MTRLIEWSIDHRWLVIGLALYFAYGFRHSRLRRDSEAGK